MLTRPTDQIQCWLMSQGESSGEGEMELLMWCLWVTAASRWMQCAEALSKFVFRDGSSTLLANVFANDKRCAGKNPPDRLYWRVIDLPGCCGAVVLLRWWCPGPGPHTNTAVATTLHSGQRQGHRTGRHSPCLVTIKFARCKGVWKEGGYQNDKIP